MYMLDTDLCGYILKRKPPSVLARLENLRGEIVCVSEITRAELLYGAARARRRGPVIDELIAELLSRLPVLHWNGAERYAELRASLEASGTAIGNGDLMIGAHALQVGAVLATTGTRHLERIPGLRLENWAEDRAGG